MTPPSDTELELLKLLWRKSPLSAREVQDQAGPSLDWTASTTRTVLERMRGKGLVVRRSVHGLAVYEASDNKVSVIGAMIRRMGEFLEVDPARAASAFSGSDLLSEDEIAELDAFLADADTKGRRS
ncbi:MAG TPA: BlaI/MecI/CopY family transcriptional regulator [Caulobacteraceae bacterium]|nr:BlaI/MecI/CopY family transcriptional regulator [Caulobacteraceae bacterium]